MLMNKKGLELHEKFKKLHDQENIRRMLNEGLEEEGWCIIENDEYVKTPEDVIGLYIYAYDTEIISVIKEWIYISNINTITFNGINLTHGQLLKSISKYYDMQEWEEEELMEYIEEKYADLLINFMNEEANNEQLEDFLGYQISADIIERKEEAIKEVVAQMPSEELERFVKKYIKKADELKYYEICICRKIDIDEEGLLKPNARDWSIFIQGYDCPTFEEAKELLKNDMEAYKCDTILGITSVSEDEFYDTNWQHIKNPIIFKRKVVKDLKDFKLTSTTTADFPTLKEIIRNYNELVEYVKNITTLEQVEEFYPFYKQYGEIEINGDTISEYEKTNEPIEMIRYEYGGWCSYIYCDIKEGKVSKIRFDVWCNKYECEFIDSITIDKLTEEYLQNAIKKINMRLGNEEMRKDERTVLIEIKTKTTEQWETLCDKLQESLDNEKVFPHIECYSTYEEGEKVPDIMNNKCYEDCEQEKLLETNSVTKDKKYYLRKAEEGYNRCYEDTKADLIAEFLAQENTNNKLEVFADDLFMNSASVEETVGYYIETYGDEALKQWLENIDCITNDTEHTKAVTKALEELYPQKTYIKINNSFAEDHYIEVKENEDAEEKLKALVMEEVTTYFYETEKEVTTFPYNNYPDTEEKQAMIKYADGETAVYTIVKK